MNPFPTLEQVQHLQRRIIDQSGGMHGLRDKAGLESALAQPAMSFDGKDLYPDLIDKAAALGFSLICNHPFADGNKRIGHAAMEVSLLMNGLEVQADAYEQEQVILAVAAGEMQREEFTAWLRGAITKLSG
ncbi:MAG: type II toxin-antitoxin system death-on-curing family toxin [Gammaproteobacteria bacterium]|nr:type II toxin-antitoxin system death-on-curing family toxin [Gammaproteobacteria bacterium]